MTYEEAICFSMDKLSAQGAIFIGYNVTLTLAKPIVPMSPILPPVRESKVMKPITESVRG
jgi:hypothetical protein